MSPNDIIKDFEEKYGKMGASYEDLERYVLYLEPELPIPYEEAMMDYKKWMDALNELENTVKEENEEVEEIEVE